MKRITLLSSAQMLRPAIQSVSRFVPIAVFATAILPNTATAQAQGTIEYVVETRDASDFSVIAGARVVVTDGEGWTLDSVTNQNGELVVSYPVASGIEAPGDDLSIHPVAFPPFPNPADGTGEVRVPFSKPAACGPVVVSSVYDALGRRLAESTDLVPAGASDLVIALDGAASGHYLYQIRLDGCGSLRGSFVVVGASAGGGAAIAIEGTTESTSPHRDLKKHAGTEQTFQISRDGYTPIENSVHSIEADAVIRFYLNPTSLQRPIVVVSMHEMGDHNQPLQVGTLVYEAGPGSIEISPENGVYSFTAVEDVFKLSYSDAEHTNSRQVFREGNGRVYGDVIGRAFKETGGINVDISELAAADTIFVNGFAMNDAFDDQLYFEAMTNGDDRDSSLFYNKPHGSPCFDSMTPTWTYTFLDFNGQIVTENTKQKVRYAYSLWPTELFANQWRVLSVKEVPSLEDWTVTVVITASPNVTPPGAHSQDVDQAGCIINKQYITPLEGNGGLGEGDAIAELFQNVVYNDGIYRQIRIKDDLGLHYGAAEGRHFVAASIAYGNDPDLFQTIHE